MQEHCFEPSSLAIDDTVHQTQCSLSAAARTRVLRKYNIVRVATVGNLYTVFQWINSDVEALRVYAYRQKDVSSHGVSYSGKSTSLGRRIHEQYEIFFAGSPCRAE